MDRGPIRTQRSEQRNAQPEKPEEASSDPLDSFPDLEQPLVIEQNAPTYRAFKTEPAQKKTRRFPMRPFGLAAVLVVVLGVLGWLGWSYSQGNMPPIDKNKYQAVFLMNGQVYFGKLEPVNRAYMRLTDIYYLQSQESVADDEANNPQQTSRDQNNVTLIKLGDEVHGPEDEMIIARDTLLFYENLKDDGKVAQTIKTNKAKDD